jgi:hypothetical protein
MEKRKSKRIVRRAPEVYEELMELVKLRHGGTLSEVDEDDVAEGAMQLCLWLLDEMSEAPSVRLRKEPAPD